MTRGRMFQVLAEILSGGPESRLHELLVQQKKLGVAVTAHYDAESLDLSTFSIVATVRGAADIGELEKYTELALQALIVDRMSAAELAHAK